MSISPYSKSPGLLLCNPSSSLPRSRLSHSGDGPVVGHKTKAVLEDSMAIEEQNRASSALVKSVLEPLQPGTKRVLKLVIYVILPKGEDRHQICPRGREERGRVHGQEGISWPPSFLKGPSEQELEQRTEPWDKRRRPRVSPRPARASFITSSRSWLFSGSMTGTWIVTESMLSLLVTR